MKFTIVATVLLGLVLTPAFGLIIGQQSGQQLVPEQPVYPIVPEIPVAPQFPQQDGQIVYPSVNTNTVIVGNQVLIINRLLRVATIEKTTPQMSWKTIWNYNTGVIATKVLSQSVCYISVMDRTVMPTFDALPSLAEQNRLLLGQLRPTKEVTYVVKRPVTNLQAYGQKVVNMCAGLTTYETYEVQGPQYTVNQGACTRLDVLHILDLVYCRPSIKV